MSQSFRLENLGLINRKSLKGKHWELWQHLSGCRQWIKVERDTATHEIFKTLKASEEIS